GAWRPWRRRVKPPRFDYLVPTSLDEALALLGQHGEEAKVLAGGQSLVPLLNFRLVRPAHLVELNEIRGLDQIRADEGNLAAEPTELLVEVKLPATPRRTGSAFLEVSRRHGDFALVGVATTLTLDDRGVCTACSVALTGVGPTPVLARDAARALVGGPPSPQ